MGRTYDFLRRKGYDNIYTEFWTPVFVGNVFDINSYPKNRKNRIYEIRGLTIGEGTITNDFGSFTVKNGSIAVFNNASILRDIIGGVTLESIKELIRFDGYWTPEATPGINTRFVNSDVGFNEHSTISGDGYTHSVTDPDNQTDIYLSNLVIPTVPGSIIYGVPFRIPTNLFNTSPNVLIEVGLVRYENGLPFTNEPMGVLISGNSADQNHFHVELAGSFHNPQSTEGVDYLGIDTDVYYDSSIIYVVAYNPNVGSNGALEIYSSDITEGNPDVPLQIPLDPTNSGDLTYVTPNSFYSRITVDNNAVGSVEIDNSRAFIPTGVTIVTGGLFDEDSVPVGCAGQAFTATDIVTEPVYIPGYGNCYNGDMMFWNADGDMQGRPWGRKDIERDVTVNIGKHTSEHILVQNDSGNTIPHPYEIINEDVYLNGRILSKSINFPTDGDYRIVGSFFIELVTSISNPLGAVLRINSFNY